MELLAIALRIRVLPIPAHEEGIHRKRVYRIGLDVEELAVEIPAWRKLFQIADGVDELLRPGALAVHDEDGGFVAGDRW